MLLLVDAALLQEQEKNPSWRTLFHIGGHAGKPHTHVGIATHSEL